LAGHDAERRRWRSIRWTLDGTHHRAFSRGRSLRRIDVRLARRPHRAGAFDVAEHFDLLDFHWTLLLRQRTVASRFVAICCGVWDGRRMVAGRGVGDGIMAAGETPFTRGGDWSRG